MFGLNEQKSSRSHLWINQKILHYWSCSRHIPTSSLTNTSNISQRCKQRLDISLLLYQSIPTVYYPIDYNQQLSLSCRPSSSQTSHMLLVWHLSDHWSIVLLLHLCCWQPWSNGEYVPFFCCSGISTEWKTSVFSVPSWHLPWVTRTCCDNCLFHSMMILLKTVARTGCRRQRWRPEANLLEKRNEMKLNSLFCKMILHSICYRRTVWAEVKKSTVIFMFFLKILSLPPSVSISQ